MGLFIWLIAVVGSGPLAHFLFSRKVKWHEQADNGVKRDVGACNFCTGIHPLGY